jgi:N-hydroxyarylamine O-acetyltransferase
MFDLEAYLARVGLRGRPSVAEVHRAQVTSIPFENLDPHCGIPVSLAVEDLERKLVSKRRGGYCFEQNLLLKAALEALGTEVDLFLARVRLGTQRSVTRPRTHLVLRVRADGATWLADVGFGLGSLLEPLPFGPCEEHTQSGWRFRVVEEEPELVLQTAQEDEWVDVYGFVPNPVPFVDVETSNWFTSTHPRSPFVTGVIVSAHASDGSRSMLRDWDGLALKEQTPAGATVTPVEQDAVPELLSTRFGLPGYAVSADGHLTPTANAYT